jgi:hypothetical protein
MMEMQAPCGSYRLSPSIEFLGRTLNVMGLIAQTADTTNLKELLFSYREYKEGTSSDP